MDVQFFLFISREKIPHSHSSMMFHLVIVTLKLSGFWRPARFSVATLVYNVYAVIVRLSFYSFFIIKFLHFLRSPSVDDAMDRLFMFPEMSLSVFRTFNFRRKQDKLFVIMGLLRDKYCVPATVEEHRRQTFFDDLCKYL